MTKGHKYNIDLDVAEIAKMVRKDIKADQTGGRLPKSMKTSVRIQRFAGGCSIDIDVMDLPGVAIFCAPDPDDTRRNCYTPEVAAVLKRLNDLLLAYNRDSSDMMSDYFNTNFYHHVEVDIDLRRAQA